MKSVEALDTNAAMRVFLKDVPEQHERVRDLMRDPSRRFLIHDMVFFEMAFTLRNHYCFTRKQIKEFCESLMALPNVVANEDVLLPALAAYAESPALSLGDCYLAEQTRATRSEPLWTFDRKFATQSPTAKLI